MTPPSGKNTETCVYNAPGAPSQRRQGDIALQTRIFGTKHERDVRRMLPTVQVIGGWRVLGESSSPGFAAGFF